NEIDALRDYSEKKTRLKKILPYTVRKRNVVNRATKHFRLTNIANYLSWLSQILKQQQGSINEFVDKIRERRPKLRRRSRQDQPEKSLDGNQINHLLEVI
ncbi:site-specific integrase, partial [Klebsiella pneumoniae]|nr:site-specific integrase [Klebsiella pneumoniae]